MDAKTTGKLIGYARVSTEDQNLTVQLDALKRAGCWNIYQEKRSATRGPRPQLDLALMDLRPGDTLLVWKFDRLVRNSRDAYRLLDVIEEKGATVRSITEPHMEATTPIGEFTMGLTFLLAQLEVKLTSQRTTAGIRAIQDRGGSYGAQPKLSEAKALLLVKLRKILVKHTDERGRVSMRQKWTKAALGEKFGISPASVSNYLKRAKAKKPKRRNRKCEEASVGLGLSRLLQGNGCRSRLQKAGRRGCLSALWRAP